MIFQGVLTGGKQEEQARALVQLRHGLRFPFGDGARPDRFAGQGKIGSDAQQRLRATLGEQGFEHLFVAVRRFDE